MRRTSCGWLVMAALLVSGCGGGQSILDSANPAGEAVEGFWWLSLASTGTLATLVIIGLLVAVRRAGRANVAARAPDARGEQTFILIAGGLVPTLFLIGFLTASVRTGGIVTEAMPSDALTIDVIGHKFWWEVRYPDHGFATANEIRIPTGEPTQVRVTSADVIHSFWVPKLTAGKIDMVPGRTNLIRMQADAPGEYRGQCTEFCGVQHALMSLLVIATSQDDFEAWIERRRTPPPETVEPTAARGREVFIDQGCGACHAIAGMERPEQAGTPGPELTGLADRRTLGALTTPNDTEHLTAWIENPHQFKPGVRMPPFQITDDDMVALVTYLETLR